MNVQQINNNDTNFKAIISHKFRGHDFKKNPELAQKILERIIPNENFTYQGKQMRATIRSLDTNRALDMLAINTERPDLLSEHCYAWIFLHEKPEGNAFQRMWKYIKGMLSDKDSQNRYDIEPYKIYGSDTTIEGAVIDLMQKIDKGCKPEKVVYM